MACCCDVASNDLSVSVSPADVYDGERKLKIIACTFLVAVARGFTPWLGCVASDVKTKGQ